MDRGISYPTFLNSPIPTNPTHCTTAGNTENATEMHIGWSMEYNHRRAQ